MIINYITNFLKGRTIQNNNSQLTSIMNDGRAIFSSWGNDIYMSDYINNCIDKIATEISKMKILSVVENDISVVTQNDEITKLFKFKPNPLQTTKDFLSSLVWLQRKNYHAFVYPRYVPININGNNTRYYTEFWPLNPTQIKLGLDDTGNVWQIRFLWKDGTEDTLLYSDLIHMKWRRGTNLILGGGNDNGVPETSNLSEAVKALGGLLDDVPKALQSAMKINGVYHAKTVVDADLLKKQRDDFESHLFDSKTGIVATDLQGEFTPVNMTIPKIDDSVMKFLRDIIRERYGVADCILKGDYTPDQYASFFQSCLEDFGVEFEQAFSPVVFSQREQDIGHKVKCYYNKTYFMSNQQKIELTDTSTNVGLLTINQLLEMWGYPPVPDGDRRIQSLNYIDVDIAPQYQLGAMGNQNNNSNNSSNNN